jgi:hypothetical protein
MTHTISIGLTIHTEDEVVELDAEDTVSIGGVFRPAMDIAMEIATANEVYKEDSMEDVEDARDFNRRNVMSTTNLDASLASIVWKNEERHTTDSASIPSAL